MRAGFAVRLAIDVLCLAGLYVSYFMLGKHRQALRGELDEPSVVMSPRASLARVPNARIGVVYYTLMLLVTSFFVPDHPLAVHAALAGAAIAALVSLYLAYSLLFVTRMPCVYCWAGHLINWSLLALVIALERSLPR